ncbi:MULTISPECIES: glycosyltransferase [Sphingomonas]|uniref:glycosyltransferase n=1 Tax=Sphingomonas TaxID=13687 RepID=UPI0013B3D6B6|nr:MULTISPECIES: glycosyltransferase [Sphingomonas]
MHRSFELRLPIGRQAAIGPRPRMGVVIHDFALGGTERIAVRLANHWSLLGVEVELFCGARSGPLIDLLHPSVKLAGPELPIARGRGSLRRLALAARAHFAAHPVDAVYIPGNTHWPVAGPLASLPAAIRPRIIAQVSAALSKPQRGPLRQRLFEHRMRSRLRHVDQVVGMCWGAARQAGRMLGRTDVTAIPLPALGQRRERLRAPVAGDAPVIFAASRLVPGKGIETLVRAFAAARHPLARLVIAGSGPNEVAIRALVSELGLEARVQLLGYVPDIRPWLDRASFLAMPSEHEGYGAVIIEALAAGRPVLATDCSPAVHELLHDPQAGQVVPICDVGALARGIEQMLARPAVDPAALAALVERFRIGPVARRYLSLVGIAPGFDGQAARLLVSANDTAALAADCAMERAAL